MMFLEASHHCPIAVTKANRSLFPTGITSPAIQPSMPKDMCHGYNAKHVYPLRESSFPACPLVGYCASISTCICICVYAYVCACVSVCVCICDMRVVSCKHYIVRIMVSRLAKNNTSAKSMKDEKLPYGFVGK